MGIDDQDEMKVLERLVNNKYPKEPWKGSKWIGYREPRVGDTFEEVGWINRETGIVFYLRSFSRRDLIKHIDEW